MTLESCRPFDPQAPLACAPWRLSGLVLGALLNDPAQLQALGAAAHAAPYKAPPRQPVLYLKPRNTLLSPLVPCLLPQGERALVCGVSLGLVLGQTLCRASHSQALEAVAALAVVADLFVPHHSLYRPAVPQRALDGSCRLSAPRPWQAGDGAPDAVELSIEIDGVRTALGSTRDQLRSAAQLLVDISAFMTLRPGDLLMTGVRHASPLLRAGQSAVLRAEGVGAVAVSLAATATAAGSAA